MRHKAYISLGGNLGRETALFDQALALLDATPGIRVQARSPVYRSEPQAVKEQPWFHNQVAALVCGDGVPENLLHAMQRIETRLGRERDGDATRFGPRTIDLDLLLFHDAVRREDELTLPHPRMAERAFVLLPLLDVAPRLCMPDGRRIKDILATLPYRLRQGCILQS